MEALVDAPPEQLLEVITYRHSDERESGFPLSGEVTGALRGADWMRAGIAA